MLKLIKSSFLVLVFWLFSQQAYADQLAYITEAQAKTTVAFLQEYEVKFVLFWCACCTNDTKEKIMIEEVSYRHTGYENYYEVVIKGKDSKGKPIETAVDLAYVHVRVNNIAKSLGKVLGFECDPCTDYFEWE